PAAPAPAPSVTEEIHDLVNDAKIVMELAATGTGLSALQLTDSVGRGGKNHPHDVASVAARMLGVGYPPGGSLTELGAAIARYQAEVVGMPHPDGRIDPGGKTIAHLRGGAAKPAAAPAAPAPHATAPAATPSGPRSILSDAELEQLVANNKAPEVQAA